jgi:uncharacterized protein (TIGR00369 family)
MNEAGQADVTRTRTVRWRDPMISAKQAGGTSGIDFLRRIVSGDIPGPPIAELLGFRLVQVEPGFALFEFEPGEHLYNPIGVVHGGVAGTLLDSAMGCSIQSTLPANMIYTTLEFKVNLVRAVTSRTGPMRAEGRVVHVGKRAGTAEGRLIDRDGKFYAHGSTTCMIMPLGER